MFNAILDMIRPERGLDRSAVNFKLGLERLLEPRESDNDPINRTKPKPDPVIQPAAIR
jgi:hypothetical protein